MKHADCGGLDAGFLSIPGRVGWSGGTAATSRNDLPDLGFMNFGRTLIIYRHDHCTRENSYQCYITSPRSSADSEIIQQSCYSHRWCSNVSGFSSSSIENSSPNHPESHTPNDPDSRVKKILTTLPKCCRAPSQFWPAESRRVGLPRDAMEDHHTASGGLQLVPHRRSANSAGCACNMKTRNLESTFGEIYPQR
jgi:hypothetical protein